ncbi:dTDP-4-dehydrorhamnose 3,5-epimerase family protein [Pseudonocardia charpentierae]|uniref:dTDP-4-dehydrorhamnose 3,5-epimerase n=1 Tax=Pseudonocardia charpentierae TaxID=3075545 RepID=A0ABU2NHX5_9PSEU|nr:dTDP-4-dehydrorhamnose 3,5-epimerase [Pseudonocardia sp. DSM 45834]MDT0353494.1 dTDP-4-dehydrorhamnose 3,5-epimerase [Pseudonocardia sp. DSM 45834]
MKAYELAISDAWVFEPTAFPDARGMFAAPFQGAAFREALGFDLTVAQTNHSVSARGVIRGVHFADTPPGQAKYVYCARGALLDVVVDTRVGSPTFGTFEVVELDGRSCRAVYLSEGLGHAFVALDDDTVAAYLCSTPYTPGAERGVTPLDPALGLPWRTEIEPVLSDKDAAAPTLHEAAEAGLLPEYAACRTWYSRLRDTGNTGGDG